MNKILDIEAARSLAQRAIEHYQSQQAPAWFIEWLEGLSIRLTNNWRTITCDEIWMLEWLEVDGRWEVVTLAVNDVLKLLKRLGRDTMGRGG